MAGRRLLALCGLPALLLLGGSQCLPSQGVKACQSALDCGTFHTCDRASGKCLCTDNRGCGDGEFCNTTQHCQPIAGCSDNTDCELLSTVQVLICDVKSARCQAADQCFQDSHCSLNRRCDLGSNSCVDACADEADCALGFGCVRDTPNAPYGKCAVGRCTQDTQCQPGEYLSLIHI